MSSSIREIELLAPARTADIGIEAIDCGADAVYIGATKFGARHAAGNSMADIERLTEYAHRYEAKVYVTLNTILYDNELEQARRLANELHDAGVDALIVQDTALLRMNLPLQLHASTQMDIRNADKVRQLHSWGFEQVVLARELGLEYIAHIHKQCPEVKLEAFVHGALCVSYSGRCYASQYCFGRSANRGECAQFCRLAFDLEDENGRTLVEGKHLLSLKDMNRSRHIEQMLDAGISSLKIEGRLKDAAYVKNTTAFYSQLLNDIIKKRPQDFRRSSHGSCHIDFEPDLHKTFNRGFTDYFLDGRREDVASIHTPKAVGQYVGKVKVIHDKCVQISGTASFNNGDGLCFFDGEGELHGFRVNRAQGNKVFVRQMPQQLVPKTSLYRNHDASFENTMQRPVPMRTLSLNINIEDTEKGFCLSTADESGHAASISVDCVHQEARTPQQGRVESELRKVGGTGFEVMKVDIRFSKDFFIPASQLNQWRRELIEKLQNGILSGRGEAVLQTTNDDASAHLGRQTEKQLDFTENIANREAEQFYRNRGATDIKPAFEVKPPQGRVVLMTCRHCIKYSLGMCRFAPASARRVPCPQRDGTATARELYLRLPDGRRFPLEFDCKRCEMRVLNDK